MFMVIYLFRLLLIIVFIKANAITLMQRKNSKTNRQSGGDTTINHEQLIAFVSFSKKRIKDDKTDKSPIEIIIPTG